MDDIAIASGHFSDHMTHLNTVFNILRKNRLTINPTKAHIGYSELEFLGHAISASGVRISDLKTKAIQKLVAAKTKKALQRTLGLLNSFRRHIPNYSARTHSIRQLLKSDTKFEWSDDCQAELDDIRDVLTKAPILAPFRSDRKIYMYTDAEKTGLGSVCLQFYDQNKPQVCSYMSLATSDAQQKWHFYQLELYAIGMAFRQNETLFLQSEIEIFTDNAVCVALEKYKPMNARETRLMAYLSQLNFKLRYIPGRMNRGTDAL